MAIRYAVATGNWSNTATWDGGTLPSPGDDVYSNTFTVTVDTDINVNILTNRSNTTPVITQGGKFVPIDGVTITANLEPGSTTNRLIETSVGNMSFTIVGNIQNFIGSQVCVYNNFSTNIIYFQGNVIGGSSSGIQGISTNGQVYMTGNITGGGGGSAAYGVILATGGYLELNGNITGGLATGLFGVVSSTNALIIGDVSNSGSGTGGSGISTMNNVTIIGNVYSLGGTSQYGVDNVTTVNLTGNIICGPGNSAVGIRNITTLNMTGNIFGGSGTNTPGASTISNANVIGNVKGGSCGTLSGVAGGAGLYCTGILNLTGNATGGDGNPTSQSNFGQVNAGVIAIGSGVITGNVYGSNTSQQPGFFGSNTSTVYINGDVQYSTIGTSPTMGKVYFRNTAPTITVTKQNLSQVTLVDPTTTDTPVITDVRDGVSYASGTLTGTLKVPPPAAVSVGVPTDNTTGTAMISITDMGALLSSYVV